MLEHFNLEMHLNGKLASGHFCASFRLHFQGIKELASVKCLAYDGWFIKRYTIELERDLYELHDHVKEAVPSSWDPKALTRLDPAYVCQFQPIFIFYALLYINYSTVKGFHVMQIAL
jgi:uncharacterized protein YjhX (UPF0386 family)